MSGRVIATRLVHPFPHVNKRAIYWAFFQTMFVALYLGVMLDIVTTRAGFQLMGSKWEQDPATALLINHFGFFGISAVMTVLCLVFYASCRLIFTRVSLKIAMVFNLILTFAVLERWITVGLTLAYMQVISS